MARGKTGEGDIGKSYSQYHSKTGWDDKRRIVEIKRRSFPSYGPDRHSLLKRLARDYPYHSYAFLLLSTCAP
jgi:hypothetical protein